jgi:uncharacterized repeat protein (TIGR01451 family)
VAGNGHPGFSGDGGPAVNAQLNLVSGLAVDNSGDLFIVCYLGAGIYNNTGVRKVSPDGIISTIAGGGDPNHPLDGQPALSVSMAAQGITVDSAGNLYLTDNLCNCITKVTTDGIVHVIGGNGLPGYSGDGGPARNAALSPQPLAGIAADNGGNIYFVLTRSNIIGGVGDCVRKISTNGIISAVAGGCTAGVVVGGWFFDPFTSLSGIAVTDAGNVYVGDACRVVDVGLGWGGFAGGSQCGFSGDGGPANEALLGGVLSVAVDNNGSIQIVDASNRRIRKVGADGVIKTIAGNGRASYSGDGGPTMSAQLDSPVAAIADASGDVYIADTNNCRVRVVSSDGIIRTVAGDGVCGVPVEGTAATLTHIGKPAGLAIDSAGRLYFSDLTYPAIWRIASDGSLQRVAGTMEPGSGGDGDGGPALSARFFGPAALDFDGLGNLYVADVYSCRVRKIVANGTIFTVAGNGGQVYSGDADKATDIAIGMPTDIALDGTGNLYIATSRLVKVSLQGTATSLTGCIDVGCAQYGATGVSAKTIGITPRGVAVGNNGAIYFGGATLVYKITTDGVATLIAGKPDIKLNYSGDGGPALQAGLLPYALTVDNSGRVYIADGYNDVRLLQPVIAPTLSISKTHTGSFTQGQTNATYTVTVSNTGSAPTSGQVTLTETVPAGMTLVSMSGGTIWNCSALPVCTTSTVLNAGSSYVPITVTVNVKADATSPQTNSVMVSGGGSATAQANDITTILLPQTITFGALADKQLGATPFTISATASSGLTVSFNSQTTSVCTVSGSTVTLVAIGTCSIQATQAGNANYLAATSVTRSFQVTQGTLSGAALSFVPITPCRVADTRNPAGAFGGPNIAAAGTRDFVIPNGACGIPATAQAYSLNAAMVPSGKGWITLYPTGQSLPLAASVNSPDGRVKSNGAIVPAGTGGAISVYASVTTDVVLDINGYFVPAASNPTALAFYPVTPCRVADTRNDPGPLGGPYMAGGSTRTFSILAASGCNIPSSAQAFSLNLAVVPLTGKLGYLTAWPAGQPQPFVASLNDPPGVVLSNGTIVPAPGDNSGQVNIFVTHDTHVVIDINGYFAPPGTGGLSLYTLQPCRVLDTRNPAGSLPFTGTLAVDVVDSGCGVPISAKDYVFNATVVPQAGSHGYLTMWQQGQAQPLAANLNSSDGAVTGNMALVPTSNGWVNAFFSGTTYLVLDLFGYFGQ